MSLERELPHYFGAGPALLPTEVLQQAAKDLINFQSIGLGAGEISHRSAPAIKIIDDTKLHLKELLNIPDNYEVFLLQGGGTSGFSSIATNLSANFLKKTGKVGKAGYVVTGSWSQKAQEEAERLGVSTETVVNSKKLEGAYKSIPSLDKWASLDPADTSYIYYCDNETVYGVEFEEFPFEKYAGIPIVADMSSNFLSKTLDITKFGCIMAGAQKNVGMAGITIYIIRKDLIEQPSDAEIAQSGLLISPIAFHYPTVIKNNSAYNTIPIFTVHVVDLVLQRLLTLGGLAHQQKVNEEKAKILYEALDSYPDLYNVPVVKLARSKMNVVFTLNGEGNDAKFLKEAESKYNLTGLKGYRTVGGVRASIYNAVELESVQLLVKFIKEFYQETK